MALLKILRESIQSHAENNIITLYHYTSVDKEELTLSPDEFGKHSFTTADKRATDYPRIFFYVDKKDQERFFRGKTFYSVDVSVNSIYDVLKDPQGIKKEIRERNNGALNFDELLRTIHNRGFKGIYYKPKREIVAWFEPITVSKHKEDSDMETGNNEVHQLIPNDINAIFAEKEVAIISAERNERTEEQNTQKTLSLKSDLKALPYKFTKAYGGFIEETGDGEKVEVEETSFMVWAEPDKAEKLRKDIISLGRKYDQEVVMIKQYDEQQAYFTSTGQDKDYIGRYVPNTKSEYFTRIGDFYFVFK